MADVQKPVVAEAPVVEPVAVPAVEEVKPAEPVAETKTEEPTKEAEITAPVEEKKEEKAEEKPVEPIYSGSLGYKAPGLKNAFRFSKKYFWFGEEAVETKNLTEYLRGEKADVAYPTAAWSSQTGKGLLFFAKHADKKETPAGVLKLSDAKELAKDGAVGFHFKLHGGKHSFEAGTVAERNSWYVAFEKAIEEAVAAEKEIVESESYKEQLEKLKKPTPHVAAASSSAPKKSTDIAAVPTTEAAAAEESTPIARAGSSSSSSSDEEKKKKKSKSKSRSVSRGKRASFFGSFIGKKEKVEEKKEEAEEKKEEKKEEKAEEKEEPVAAPATEAAVLPVAPVAESAPVIPEEVVKPAEEPIALDGAAETKTEEKKPKPTKRGSIFGTIAQKLKSPTTEKKESEVAPVVPAKDTEAAPEAPKTEDAPVVPEAAPVAAATDAPKTEETKPATGTPHKEKEHFSFGKFLGKAKSPTTETPPKVEETPKKEATPEPVVATEATEAAKEEEKKEEAPLGVTSTAAAAPAPKAKRGSIFGNFGGSVKKEKEGESSEKKGLGGLFRNASKSIRPKKEEKAAATPAKVDETAEPKEEEKKTEEAPKEENAAEKKTEPATIGDVVPEAVTVGQAPKSTPEVSATA